MDENWGPSIRAICRATSYEDYLRLVVEEAADELVAEVEAELAAQ